MSIMGGTCVAGKLAMVTGRCQPTDKYYIALYAPGAKIDPFTEAYTTDGEVRGKGYTAGGLPLEGYCVEVDGDVVCINWDVDPVWNNASIRAAGALIYNRTRGNVALAVVEFDEPVTSTNGRWTFPMPRCNKHEAILRFA